MNGVLKWSRVGVISALVLAGCGSSHKALYIGKGVYIDSPVQGVSYQCGSESGLTNRDGEFYYELNQSCQFSIGEFPFKKIPATQLTKGSVKIIEKTPTVARLLQTLDSDGDASNGITVPQDAGALLTPTQGLDDKQIKSLHQKLQQLSDYQGKYITIEQAKAHLERVEKGVEKLHAKLSLSATTLTQGETITLDASASEGDIVSYLWKLGDKILGAQAQLTLATDKVFTLGTNRVTLIVEDQAGHTDTLSASFTLKAPPTIWDRATVWKDGGKQLLVTSDVHNLYFRFVDDSNRSASDISSLDIYINSDGSAVSGAGSRGFDYKLNSDGLFKLSGKEDYNGERVQDINDSAEGNRLDLAIDRKNIEYLVKDITIAAFISANELFVGSAKQFEVNPFTPPIDKVPPVIMIDTNQTVLELEQNSTLPDILVTAYDVGDSKSVTVHRDDSSVQWDKEGYYTYYFIATDSKNNTGRKGINIHIKGAPSSSKLEVKPLGDLNESVAIDHQTGLVWANDATVPKIEGDSTRGCLVIGEGAKDVKESFTEYCQNSNYAGFTDWRIPTAEELSRFTVRMYDEGKTPGMARRHCIRTLGLQEGKLVPVTTHIIATDGDPESVRLIGQIKSGDAITPAGGRCVRGISHDDSKVSPKDENGAQVIIDKIDSNKPLMWVSEYTESKDVKPSCLAIHYDKPEEYNQSKTFCENISYAGFDDWRDPTPIELSKFVKETYRVHLLPGYLAPCIKLLARDQEGNKTIEKEVYTRFAIKKPGKQPGEIADLNLSTNIGLRCVREMSLP